MTLTFTCYLKRDEGVRRSSATLKHKGVKVSLKFQLAATLQLEQTIRVSPPGTLVAAAADSTQGTYKFEPRPTLDGGVRVPVLKTDPTVGQPPQEARWRVAVLVLPFAWLRGRHEALVSWKRLAVCCP